jgi:hypothetical protein
MSVIKVYIKTLHRKQKLEQHEHGVNSSVSVKKAVSAPLIISFLFFIRKFICWHLKQAKIINNNILF